MEREQATPSRRPIGSVGKLPETLPSRRRIGATSELLSLESCVSVAMSSTCLCSEHYQPVPFRTLSDKFSGSSRV